MIRMNHGEKQWNDVAQPLTVVTGQGNKHGVVAAHMSTFYGTGGGRDVGTPAPTVTGQGQHAGIVAATLVRYYSSGGQTSDVGRPLMTVTAREGHALVAARCEAFPVTLDVATLAGAKRVGRFMTALAGPTDPCAAAPRTAKQLREKMAECRRARVKPRLAFRPAWILVRGRAFAAAVTKAAQYLVVDLALRMFTPRELARAQSFPDDYVLPPQSSVATKLIGNSVPPLVVKALMRANVPELCVGGAA